MMVHETHARIKQKTTAGPAPANNGVTNVAEYPIQVFVMEKAMASVEVKEKIRGICVVDPLDWARKSVAITRVCRIGSARRWMICRRMLCRTHTLREGKAF
jgi:hypothetical protein